MWDQFRRLLLGTVIELLLEQDIEVDFKTIKIAFDPVSVFKVPRFDNYMRFKGSLKATLVSEMPPATRSLLANRMRDVWPKLLKVVDIPIGDRLTSERNNIFVGVTDGVLTVAFDLEAD